MIHGVLFALRNPLRFILTNLIALTMRPGVSYYNSSRWKKIREYIWDRDNGTCTVRKCGKTRGLDTHHKKPISRGGSHFTWNLTLLCQFHHARRHPANQHLQDRAKRYKRGEFPH